MRCAVLYCALLCCTVLCCAVLQNTVLCYALLHCPEHPAALTALCCGNLSGRLDRPAAVQEVLAGSKTAIFRERCCKYLNSHSYARCRSLFFVHATEHGKQKSRVGDTSHEITRFLFRAKCYPNVSQSIHFVLDGPKTMEKQTPNDQQGSV